MKGYFITFEGIEGSGKSTQAKLLREYLEEQGINVFLTREPGGPLISERIRAILLDNDHSAMLPETELLLYAASRSQHTGEWILPMLEQGITIISDRYFDSTIAYQGAARSINMNIINNICRLAAFNLVPDLTYLIDLPVETGLGRIEKDKADRLEKESLAFHRRVREGFLNLAAKEKRIKIIDGQKSIEEINSCIIEKYKKIRKK